jgi:TonB family protein
MHTWKLLGLSLAATSVGCGTDSNECDTSSDARLVQLASAGDLSNARQLGLKGEASVEVLVGVQDGGGYVAEAKVVASSGTPILDRAALYSARYSTYEPASCNGAPVPGIVVVKVALP